MKTLKANGENAQVSYNPEIKAWIIASKNVALIARSKSDIELYHDQRYEFAREIAKVWFNKLEDIKSQSNEIYQSLKKDISNRTLVGEYVNSIKH